MWFYYSLHFQHTVGAQLFDVRFNAYRKSFSDASSCAKLLPFQFKSLTKFPSFTCCQKLLSQLELCVSYSNSKCELELLSFLALLIYFWVNAFTTN